MMWSSEPGFEEAFAALLDTSRLLPPPASNTEAEKPDDTSNLSVSVHWVSATTKVPFERITSYLAERSGYEARPLGRGGYGYRDSYVVGPVRVYTDSGRAESLAVWDGDACDAFGFHELRLAYHTLELRASRFDSAVDNCPFTPHDVRSDWMSGNVRTRVKAPDVDALAAAGYSVQPDYEGVRRCDWRESPTGNTFAMGSRSSEQYARCYDRRGSTRFELEHKGRTAAAAADAVFGVADDEVAGVVVGLVRRFVDFVDASVVDESHMSRAPLLGWWSAFVDGVGRFVLDLSKKPPQTVEGALRWVVYDVAPTLAMIAHLDGGRMLSRIICHGRDRWGQKHFDMAMSCNVDAASAYLTTMIPHDTSSVPVPNLRGVVAA